MDAREFGKQAANGLGVTPPETSRPPQAMTMANDSIAAAGPMTPPAAASLPSLATPSLPAPGAAPKARPSAFTGMLGGIFQSPAGRGINMASGGASPAAMFGAAAAGGMQKANGAPLLPTPGSPKSPVAPSLKAVVGGDLSQKLTPPAAPHPPGRFTPAMGQAPRPEPQYTGYVPPTKTPSGYVASLPPGVARPTLNWNGYMMPSRSMPEPGMVTNKPGPVVMPDHGPERQLSATEFYGDGGVSDSNDRASGSVGPVTDAIAERQGTGLPGQEEYANQIRSKQYEDMTARAARRQLQGIPSYPYLKAGRPAPPVQQDIDPAAIQSMQKANGAPTLPLSDVETAGAAQAGPEPSRTFSMPDGRMIDRTGRIRGSWGAHSVDPTDSGTLRALGMDAPNVSPTPVLPGPSPSRVPPAGSAATTNPFQRPMPAINAPALPPAAPAPAAPSLSTTMTPPGAASSMMQPLGPPPKRTLLDGHNEQLSAAAETPAAKLRAAREASGQIPTADARARLQASRAAMGKLPTAPPASAAGNPFMPRPKPIGGNPFGPPLVKTNAAAAFGATAASPSAVPVRRPISKTVKGTKTSPGKWSPGHQFQGGRTTKKASLSPLPSAGGAVGVHPKAVDIIADIVAKATQSGVHHAAVVPGLFGASLGGIAGAVAPGNDENGKQKSRLRSALTGAGVGGALGAGTGVLGFGSGLYGGMATAAKELETARPQLAHLLNKQAADTDIPSIGLLLSSLATGSAGVGGTIGALDAKPGQRLRGFNRGAFGGLGAFGGAALGAVPAMGVGAGLSAAGAPKLLQMLGASATGLGSAMLGRRAATGLFDTVSPEKSEEKPKAKPAAKKKEKVASMDIGMANGAVKAKAKPVTLREFTGSHKEMGKRLAEACN